MCGRDMLGNPSLVGRFPAMSHFPRRSGVSWHRLPSLLSWESPKGQLAVIFKSLPCATNCARHLKHVLSFSLIKKPDCGGHLPSLQSDKKLRLRVATGRAQSVEAE